MKGLPNRPKREELTPIQREILTLQRNLWDVKTPEEIDDLFDIAAKQIGQAADLPDKVGTLLQAIVGAKVDYEASGNIFAPDTWDAVKALYLQLLAGKKE
jgi:hypothetical protein